MSVLGINISGETAWLSLIDERGQLASEPDRFLLSSRPRPEALRQALEDLRLVFHRHDVNAIGVLDAQGTASPRSYGQARRRLALETIIEIAAAQSGVDFALVAPATVQARLRLPSRRIGDHVEGQIERRGMYWNKRGLAALVALAVIAGA